MLLTDTRLRGETCRPPEVRAGAARPGAVPRATPGNRRRGADDRPRATCRSPRSLPAPSAGPSPLTGARYSRHLRGALGPVRDAQIIGDVVGRVVAPQHRGPRRRGGVVVQDLVPGVPIGEADAGEGVVATCEAAYAEVAVPPVDSAIATFRWRRTAMRAPSCRRTVVPVSASRCDR